MTAQPPGNGRGFRRILMPCAQALIILLVGVFLLLGLQGDHPRSSALRHDIIAHGSRDTGAPNLVTAIYLGFRAFDTLGETIVLLMAVSGVLYFIDRKRDEENRHS